MLTPILQCENCSILWNDHYFVLLWGHWKLFMFMIISDISDISDISGISDIGGISGISDIIDISDIRDKSVIFDISISMPLVSTINFKII